MAEPVKPHCKRAAIAIASLFVLTLIALVISILSWVRMSDNSKTQTTLVQEQLSLQSEKNALARDDLARHMQDQHNALANKVAELDLPKQSQRVLSEVDYLLRLANLNLTLGRDPRSALKLMSLADQRLAQFDDPSQNHLRRAIINDMHKIMRYPHVDTTGILLQLGAIGREVQKLPNVPNHMPKAKINTPSKPTGWHARFKQALTQIKSLIIIRHHNDKSPALLPPEQFQFVKDNVDLAIAKAQWATLHQNDTLYQDALKDAINWLTHYNNYQAAQVAPIVSSLAIIQHLNVTAHYPSILNSLVILQKLMQQPAIMSAPVTNNSHPVTTPSQEKPEKKPQSKLKPHDKATRLPSLKKSVEA